MTADYTAAAGKRSLKILDAPGLQNIWNPHYVYQLKHTSGTSKCAFDMRIGKDVRVNHEWRDWRSSPYGVGPSFSIDGAQLKVAGRTLLKLPVDQWFHIEIAAGLGDGSKNTWDMLVTLPGHRPKEFKSLKNGNAKFGKLTWIGFTSNATKQTVFYLDNITIDNKA